MKLRIVLLAVAVTVALAAVPAVARAQDAPAPVTPAPATPVFSLRRVPDLLARTVADTHLGADLDRVMSDPALGGARDTACLAVGDAGGGRSHYTRQAAQLLIPASTLKLMTGAAALSKLGPDSHFTTEVRAGAAPANGGVDDLYLVGGGDPLLATADYSVDAGYQGQSRMATPIEALADKVVATGIRRVNHLLGDESRYDTQRLVPSWSPSYAAEFEISPLSALVVNKAFSSTRPPAVAVSPPAHAAGVLAGLLRARGVTVGTTGAAKTPGGAPLVTSIDSAPLSEVVGEILRNSDNMGAEMLLKELSASPGTPGSTAAGLSALVAQLQKVAGVTSAELAAVDGSGLDRTDKISCAALERVLDTTGEDGPLAKGLPEAGRDGTLWRRFLGSAAAGKVRAKTGSLNGVAGLAGFATDREGRDLSFALLANGLPNEATGSALQDKVVNVLAAYPRGPAADELAPKVAAPPAG
jgi:D-alanyl-D-alanine carboxypeptidase/D-alanyl-D-alanine-endopeptidase (penicillin-binding protein 4)